MNISQPTNIRVVSMSPYKYVHYVDERGNNYLSLHQEIGFAGYSEDIILTEAESLSLNTDAQHFIGHAISSFNIETKSFEFHKSQRHIPEFKTWECVKAALTNWHRCKNT
ncbi:hypothetical protein ACMZOO_00885 [Catenovulum sp. SX2]|uniref:hypothetical protein n=1 Tax=Catenovulum sp. SX2 TaxID=3398614 RepID=UPI003F86A8CA